MDLTMVENRSVKQYIAARLGTILTAIVLAVFLTCITAQEAHASAEWYRFQNSMENNGVTDVEMPGSYNEAALKWGRSMVLGYTTSFTPPLIINGDLYTASKERVYRIDKETGEIKAESDEMLVNVSYAMHPMTYCEEKGLLFLPLLDGRVQCIDADTLELKWISKAYKSTQALSPITYKDGMVYTGIWSSELKDGVYFGLDADTGETKWEFRPAEQHTETVAKALDTFAIPTGMSRPENYYTYTALIKVKPKNGFKFAEDEYSKCWLCDSQGNKYVPSGMDKDSMVQSTVNGYSATFDPEVIYNEDGTTTIPSVTIRVRFDYYNGQFTQEGSSDQVSSVMLTGLDIPEVGKSLDTAVSTDSNITIENLEWRTGDIPHGFYWAGPYVNDNYVIFGSDDGQNNTFGAAGDATYTDTSILYSVDRRTGELKDKIEGCRGDIRSTIVYHNGYVYYTSKGGRLYKVKLNSNGTFDHNTLSYYQMDGMMTASPVVHGGRIYVGVSGLGGQFQADGGHMFAVLNDNDLLYGSYDSSKPGVYPGSLIYTTQIAGYPQASPLLSTGASDGHVRLYFTFNAFPGGIYYLEDFPTATGDNHNDAELLFKPEMAMRQYCISPLCVDSQGTMYIKNDSGYLMAVAVNKAYLPTFDPDNNIYGIKVTAGDYELDWNEPFEAGILNYTLTAPNGTESADIELDVPDGMTATINGDPYNGTKYTIPVSEDMSAVTVTVKKTVGSKLYTRTYTLNVGAANNNANLGGLFINDTNTAPGFIIDYGDNHTNTKGIGFDPVFDPGVQKYVSRMYNGSKTFVNVWVQTDDPDATVKAYPVDSVGNVLSYMNEDGSIPNKGTNGKTRFPVYWIKGKISAEIKIVVTPPSGNEEAQKEYNIELVRSEDHLDVGNDPLLLSVSSATLYTSGSNRTMSVRATYGEKDVTDKCTWYSSRPDIASVDAHGNVAAQDKEGDAVIWACYGAQDTEDRPLSVKVRSNVCASASASLASGKYDSEKSIELTTATSGAEIYYNIGEGQNAVPAPNENSTKYTGPIVLGEQGVQKKYKIRAIVIKEGLADSTVADFDYTIDLRKSITSVEINGLDAPSPDQPLDTDIAVEASDQEGVLADAVNIKSIKWYKVTESGEEEVTGNAEGETDYRLKMVLESADESRFILTGSTVVKSGDRYFMTSFNEDSTVTVTADYETDPKPISVIALTGVNALQGGGDFDATVYSTTNGIRIKEAVWHLADGSEVPDKAGYDTEYRFDIIVEAEEGYVFADDAAAKVNVGGVMADASAERNSDGTYTVSVICRTAKIKLDTSAGSGFTVNIDTLPDFENGTSISDIRMKLRNDIVVTALLEDGSTVEIPKDNVYWDEDVIEKAYDSGAVSGASFRAAGKVILPDNMDANGSSLTVTVGINVLQGTVAAPVLTPASGTYGAPQTVTMSCETKGAVIMFTRSDEDGTSSYEEPFTISGTSGKKVTYIFKMFAQANGIKSETVKYTLVIDRTPEAADASKNSINKITPNEAAVHAAKENKSVGKVSSVKCMGYEKQKVVSLLFGKVAGAANYRIEYRKAGTSAWYYLWTKGKTSAAIGGLQKGASYEFRIAPFKVVSGFWQRGPWSASQYQYIKGTTFKLTKGKKSFTAKVGKVKGASGYKVKYSLKKNMKGAKTKTFKGWKKVKLQVKKLKAKKNYYVQVCPYKKTGGKIYIGAWSAVKKVKTK